MLHSRFREALLWLEPMNPGFASCIDLATTMLCGIVGGLLSCCFLMVRHRPKVKRDTNWVRVRGGKSEATEATPPATGLKSCMGAGCACGIVFMVLSFTWDGFDWWVERVTIAGILGTFGGLAIWTTTSPWPTAERETPTMSSEEDTK